MTTSVTYPKCEFCGRTFQPGQTWFGANFCRAAFLAGVVEAHPGLSTWEISQKVGMLYSDTTKAMQKARDWQLVTCSEEQRGNGGVRFRYTIAPEADAIIAGWAAQGKL